MRREVCYAYREQHCTEGLWQHLKEVSECMKSSDLCRRISRKVSWLAGNAVEVGEVEELLSVTGLLHDIGKSFDKFQKKSIVKTFEGHDLLGASLVIYAIYGIFSNAVKTYRELSEYAFKQPMDLKESKVKINLWLTMNIVALPILFSHYAQHEYKYWSGGWKKYLSEEYSFNTCSYILEEFKSYAQQYSHQLARNLLKGVIEVLSETQSIRFLTADSISSLLPTFRGSSTVHHNKYLVMAVAGLLNMCDGRVAMENRRTRSE